MKNFLLLLILTTLIISCDSTSDSNNNDSQFGRINGKVITKNLYPIQGAEIYTIPPTEVLVSKSNGEFIFVQVPIGLYRVYAKKEGYSPKYVNISILGNKTSEATIVLDNFDIDNDPPNKPILISPTDDITLNTQPTLEWRCTDPENDILLYDVYFGLSANSLQIIESGIDITEYQLSGLSANTKYFWKIGAFDDFGGYSESDLWSFNYKEIEPTNALILNLSFDNNVNDMSNYAHFCQQTNLTYTKNRFGNDNSAAYLNGSAYVEVIKSTFMDFTQPFTIALWIKPDPGYGNTFEGEVDLVSRYGTTTSNMSSFAFLLKNGYLSSEVFKSQSGRSYCPSDVLIQTNIWTHVTLVYNGTSLILFANGVEVAQSIVPKPDSSNLNLYIGKRSLNNRIFKGAIDDVKVYNKALTKAEISQLAK
ncbi:MAG: hypothetical protein CVV22_02185 [Ignavibacteriae bacterium HGW-Ignavibacteriae-1]|jgi:hypothetical protein|nr:MAG: hypothetical protein CVV22_02185 [Ignavibacteriae bacterium HGW-Ignavibacteriae-1]